jgi:hypothetical protein
MPNDHAPSIILKRGALLAAFAPTIGFIALSAASAWAQTLSGNFRNTTINIAKGTDGDMSLNVQVGKDGQPAVTGGVTVKGGDSVGFDGRGSLKTDTAGFWKGTGDRTYTVLFRDAKGNGLLLVEVQGEVRWNKDRNIFQGQHNFLRLATKEDTFVPISSREIKSGRLVVTAQDGSAFTLYNFSCDFTGTASVGENVEIVSPPIESVMRVAKKTGLLVLPFCATNGSVEEKRYAIAMAQNLWDELKRDPAYEITPPDGVREASCAAFPDDRKSLETFLNSLVPRPTTVLLGPRRGVGRLQVNVIKEVATSGGNMTWDDFSINTPQSTPVLSSDALARIKQSIEFIRDR